MKYFIALIFTMILSLSFSQKMVYRTETLSMSSITNGKIAGWSKEEDVDIVIVLDIDSSGVDVKRSMLIYSAEYREFELGEFEYSYDDKGNYLIVFEAYDTYNDMDCKITIFSTKKKSYLVVEYDKIAVRYLLDKKYSISNVPK